MVNILEVMSRIYRENTWSEDVLFRVQDCIGPVYTWPLYIKHILRSKAFRYHERIKLTTFFFINGFRDHEGWLEFVVRIKGAHCRKYHIDLKNLFNYFFRDDVQFKYFSYCLTHKRYEFLNGNPKVSRNL